jgi:hypothetical protein
MKKLALAAIVFVGAVVVLFAGFTLIKCNKGKPVSLISQLHMVVAPATQVPDKQWQALEDVIRDRCSSLSEFRVFQVVEDSYAVFETSGAKDPNMLASMLLMKGDAQILTATGEKIASGKEIQMAGIVMPQSGTGKPVFGVQIDEVAAERLGFHFKGLKPGQKLKCELFVDSVKTLISDIQPSETPGMLIFRTPEKMNISLLDYLGQAITYKLPYDLAVNRDYSFFIPPQSDKAATIDFVDILGKILLEQKDL